MHSTQTIETKRGELISVPVPKYAFMYNATEYDDFLKIFWAVRVASSDRNVRDLIEEVRKRYPDEVTTNSSGWHVTRNHTSFLPESGMVGESVPDIEGVAIQVYVFVRDRGAYRMVTDCTATNAMMSLFGEEEVFAGNIDDKDIADLTSASSAKLTEQELNLDVGNLPEEEI